MARGRITYLNSYDNRRDGIMTETRTETVTVTLEYADGYQEADGKPPIGMSINTDYADAPHSCTRAVMASVADAATAAVSFFYGNSVEDLYA